MAKFSQAQVRYRRGYPLRQCGVCPMYRKAGGSIFAMLSSRGQFVVKLPRRRVDELIAAGEGDRYDPGHGRLMKEWLALAPGSSQDWVRLAGEALDFVGSGSR